MLFRDHFGEQTLCFAVGQLWNLHACRPTPGYMPQASGNPVLYADATYIKRALQFFSDRPDRRRGEFVDDEAIFHCFSSNHHGMDSQERAEWYHRTYPRMVREHLGFRLEFSPAQDGWWSPEVARTRFSRWHHAVRRTRGRKQQHIAALLQHACVLLHLRVFDRNTDVVDTVLRHSLAALFDLHNLDPETRQPLPCI
jgi:hypothetical protein